MNGQDDKLLTNESIYQAALWRLYGLGLPHNPRAVTLDGDDYRCDFRGGFSIRLPISSGEE